MQIQDQGSSRSSLIKDYTDQALVDQQVNTWTVKLIRAGFVFEMDIPLTKVASWPAPEITSVRVCNRVRVGYSDFPNAFDTTLLSGQYFSSTYLWAIATAMLHSMVASIAEQHP